MKIKIIFIALIMIILLSGCTSDTPDSNNADSTAIQMEDWEKELLRQTYDTDIEIEKLNSGDLYSHQKEMLEQTRAFKKYLEEKYPGHEFTITKITLSNLINGNSDSYDFLADDGDTVFKGIVREDNGIVFQDNYYAFLLQPIYDEALKKELEKFNISTVCIYTLFPSNLGKEINSSLTAEDLFSLGNEVPRTTNIYVNTDLENAYSQIKNVIEQAEIYGYYTVHYSELFSEGLDWEEYEEIRKKNDSVVYKSFSFGYGN